MAKTIKVLVNTGNEQTNKTFDVTQGSGKAGKPTAVKAIKGARYQLEDPAAKNVGPENIRTKRVGKNLHVMLDGSSEADLIIEGYYDEDMLTETNRGLYGRAEDGKLYEYIPEDPTPAGLPINLADGGKPTSQVLGGGQVGEDFALSGVILAAAGGGFGALTAGAAAVGAAALAGGGGGGGGTATTPDAAAALTAIKDAAQANNATDANVAASVFANAGVTGVDATNVAAIQSALNSAAVNGLAADTKEEVQAIVDAYNAIKTNADGTANNNATNPTQAQYTAIGVTGVDTATEESLLGDAIDAKPFSAVDTVPEVQTMADAAAAVITGAAGGTAPTKEQLEALGITGVTDANLAAVQAAIAATDNNGTGVDTLAELQAVANAGATNAANAAAALNLIKEAAENNSASSSNLAASVFATAGVTGVTADNLAAIQSALDDGDVQGNQADTLAEVQAIVDAYNAIKSNADATANNNATNPTAAQYTAIGVTGVNSDVKTSLLGDVVDAKAFDKVDTVGEVQALADATAAVMTGAAGGTAPTKAQLEALGITGVTDANLAYVQASIARTADDGIGVDTLAELQAVVTIGADAAAAAAAAAVAAAREAIRLAAENNNATDANVAASVFATAGVTGVDSTNVAAIQSALNSANVNGLATDTLVEVQNIVNAYNAIRENADGTANNYASNPTQTDYALIGVNGVNSAEQTSLLGDAIDAKPFSAVDTVVEVQTLADAAAAVMTGATGGTAPTQAQLNALGITGVTPANLAAVQAAIAANGSGAAGVDTLSELQTVVTNAANAAAALDTIKAAAEGDTAASSNLAASVFATAGVTGVTPDNLAAIQSALDSAAVNGAAADTKPEVQAIVDAYNAIKANADNTPNNNATNPTQAQYAAIGVTGVDTATEESLLGDAIDGKPFSAVDSVPEVQALADAAAAVIASTTTGTRPTLEQLTALGITGVTPANLAAVQAAIAASGNGGTGVDTLSELQAITDAATATAASNAALELIKNAAEGNTAGTTPSVTDFGTAGITGVDTGNLAAISSALNSGAVNGNAADTKGEVQAIVDAYKAIKDNADTPATANATAAQYTAVGVTGIDSPAKANLLGDVVDGKDFADVDTVPELQALATAAAAVIAGATGGTAPTQAQLNALGITGVTPANLAAVQAAIAATGNGGAGVDTLSELQTVVTNAAAAAAASAAALSTIAAAAQANDATNANVGTGVFATAGITGVDINNIAAIQSALNDDDVQSGQADTAAKVQAVVNAYNAIKANADTAGTANATQAQYAAIGVNGIDNAAKTSLLGDVVDTKAFGDVDTVAKVQALADLAALVINSAGTGTAPTKEQLQALGITGVTDANLAAIQAAIAATPDDGTGVDTLSELQAVANTGATNAANAAAAAAALSTIAAAAQANDASNTNVPYTLFATAGVTGVDSTNVAAIQSALNDDDVQSGQADTAAKVQVIVDAYKAILAEANDTANSAGNSTADGDSASNPTAAQYAAIGVNLGSAPTDAATDTETLALLNAIVSGKQTADVDTVAKVQELATIANAIQLKAAGGTPSPALTIADLQKIGLDTTGVSTDNLPTLLAAIAAKSDTGSETDTLEKLQALITSLDKVAPVAVNDTSSATEDALIQTGNVSTNDTSLQGGETFAVVGSSVGNYGTLVLNSSGVYSYTYNTGIIHAITANVTDTFTYRVTDAAGNTSTATLAVTVTPVNDAPVNTVPSATQILAEDATVSISGLSIADVDAGTGNMTVTLGVTQGTLTVAAGTGVTLGTNGSASVTLTGTVSAINTLLATANAVTYAPTANYNGSATLTMLTSDGSLSDSDNVAISVTAVNDLPTGAVTISGNTAVGSVLTATSTVADVEGLGTLSYSWYATANGTTTAISGATGSTYTLASGDAGKTITAKVSYTDGGGTAESVVSTATAAVTAVTPGQAVIDLGGSGKLITPVQVEGKWYYYWDRSGNGNNVDTGTLNGGTDKVTHDVLDTIFNQDINGNVNPNGATADTNDVYRYATINGVQLSLPTMNGNLAYGRTPANTPSVSGGGATNNSVYDEWLALWDNYLYSPYGWVNEGIYWTATKTGDQKHEAIFTADGSNYGPGTTNTGANDTNARNVALQVVAANAAPVLDATQSPTITGVSAGAAAPVNGTTTGSDLVSTLVGGITDGDAGATKGIAITGVNSSGTLYYSVDGGTTWLTATGVSDTNALLLAADSNTRVYYKANGTTGTISDAITFRAWDMTANITEGVYTDTTPRGGKAQFSTATDTVSVVSTVNAGDTVIDLGASGKLIKPVQVEGKWYYFWDTNGDNTGTSLDKMTHTQLDAIFNQDINGNVNPNGATADTNDVYRYATINGVQLALPTANGGIAVANNTFLNGTAYTDAGTTSNGTNSAIYDDLLAIWDAYNGASTTNTTGIPAGWSSFYSFASATYAAPNVHAYALLPGGYTYNDSYNGGDDNTFNMALQVVAANAAPVLADTALTLTGVSAGAAAPVNGTTTGSDLVSTLVGGITDADASATKGIAITGVHSGATLYYSTNGGTTWTAASGLSDTNALLLAADTDTRVYYKANGTSGTITDAITFRAWDMTANITEGVYTSTAANGGKAQFSTATDTVSVVSSLPLSNSLNFGTHSSIYLNLINKHTASDGKVYYFVDITGDGTSSNTDILYHSWIDNLFNALNTDTTGLSSPTAGVDTERSFIVNGYTLVLPTVTELTSSTFGVWPSNWNNQIGYWTATQTATDTHNYVTGNWSTATGGTSGSAIDNTSYALVVQVLVPVAPVVLDLNRDGTFSYSQVAMDVNGSNHLSLTQWAGAQDGVLVWDKLGDGVVHDNSQYAFGQYATSTRVDAAGYNRVASDLDGLSDAFDTNHDGKFNAADAQFAQFSVWQDANQNGVSDAGEVRSLADWGMTSINLVSDGVQRTPVAGVTEVGQSTAALADGSSMQVADALFAYNALDYTLTGAASGDTLNLLGSNMTLDLSSVAAVHSNVTAIDLTGSAVNGTTGANTLKLNLADVLTLPLASSAVNGVHKLTLTGDANDTVELDLSQWANTGNTVTEGDHTYAVYNASSAAAAQLLIDQHMVLASHG
jgi:VCBS repeat-containing protein